MIEKHAQVLAVGGRTVVAEGADGRRVVLRSYPELRLPSRVLLAAEIGPDDVVSVSSPAAGVVVIRLEIEAGDRPPDHVVAAVRERLARDPDPTPFF